MSFDRPRPETAPADRPTRMRHRRPRTPHIGDGSAQSSTDLTRGALQDLAAACVASHLHTRSVDYRGHRELRIWNPRTQGAAVQIGANLIDGVMHYTRQGKPLAPTTDMPKAMNAVYTRLRIRR